MATILATFKLRVIAFRPGGKYYTEQVTALSYPHEIEESKAASSHAESWMNMMSAVKAELKSGNRKLAGLVDGDASEFNYFVEGIDHHGSFPFMIMGTNLKPE